MTSRSAIRPRKARGRGGEKIALDHGSSREVDAGAADCDRVEVRRQEVESQPRQGREQGGADGSRAAAEVDDDRTTTGEPGGLAHERLCASPRHEDPGFDVHPQPAEQRPAEDVFERLPAHPALQQVLELVRRPSLAEEELRFLLGEDASRRAEAFDDAGEGRGGIDRGHRNLSGIARGMRTGVECP
ncbi:hypothetical protein [Cryobacterium sp. GrIS_2_6]|uniref:hypothetical protein n=1 Tax=Cryobacterium sp. GrIS_2_6 TaxID=3162785 RepID=UPI002DFA063B|nr:hypothetical protein [Cryobacterium psychrotolerans]